MVADNVSITGVIPGGPDPLSVSSAFADLVSMTSSAEATATSIAEASGATSTDRTSLLATAGSSGGTGSNPTASAKEGSGIDTGAAVGGGVAGLVLLLLIVLGALLWRRKHSKGKRAKEQAQPTARQHEKDGMPRAELHADAAAQELPGRMKPQELPGSATVHEIG